MAKMMNFKLWTGFFNGAKSWATDKTQQQLFLHPLVPNCQNVLLFDDVVKLFPMNVLKHLTKVGCNVYSNRNFIFIKFVLQKFFGFLIGMHCHWRWKVSGHYNTFSKWRDIEER